MKSLLKVSIIIILIYVLPNVSIASTVSELQNEQSSISNEIEENKQKLDEITNEKSEVLTQVENLSSQISVYETEIEQLTSKISNLQSDIDEMQETIKKDEEQYEKDKIALKDKLVVMYENGSISYLDVLLSSNSLTDYISSYYLISELTNYDTEMLQSLEKEKEKIENEKKKVENEKQELDISKNTQAAKQESLKVAKADKEKQVSKLTVEEKETQSKIDELKEANREIDKQIEEAQAKIAAAKKAAEEAAKKKAAEEAERKKAEAEAAKSNNKSNASTNSSNSGSATSNTSSNSSNASTNKSSYGFIRPVSSKFPITTKWYYSSGSLHGAVDFSGSGISGAPIYAVADGYVVTSTALKDSNGNYKSYGNYILIAHFNGLYTLYAHCSQRNVSAGEVVTQGQVIGSVGSTGNSTGPHLHFEVRTSPGKFANRVNPLNYLP